MKLSERELAQLEDLFRQLSTGKISESEFNSRRAKLLRAASSLVREPSKPAERPWEKSEEEQAEPWYIAPEPSADDGEPRDEAAEFRSDANRLFPTRDDDITTALGDGRLPLSQVLILLLLLAGGVMLILKQRSEFTGITAERKLTAQTDPLALAVQQGPLPQAEPILAIPPASFLITPVFGPDAVTRCEHDCAGAQACLDNCRLESIEFFARQLRSPELSAEVLESLIRADCRKAFEKLTPAPSIEDFVRSSRQALAQLKQTKAPPDAPTGALLTLYRNLASLNASIRSSTNPEAIKLASAINESSCLRSYLYLAHLATVETDRARDTFSRRLYARLRLRLAALSNRAAQELSDLASAKLGVREPAAEYVDPFPPPELSGVKPGHDSMDPATLPYRSRMGEAWSPTPKPMEQLYVCRTPAGIFSCSYLDYEQLQAETTIANSGGRGELHLIRFDKGLWVFSDPVPGFTDVCNTAMGRFYCPERDKELHGESLP